MLESAEEPPQENRAQENRALDTISTPGCKR
jgi:hypothetical protein